MKPDTDKNLQRLQWACRRGMLELDVLFGNFLEKGYSGLTPADERLFFELLECADTDLYAWLLGTGRPQEDSLNRIVEIIRQHARP